MVSPESVVTGRFDRNGVDTAPINRREDIAGNRAGRATEGGCGATGSKSSSLFRLLMPINPTLHKKLYVTLVEGKVSSRDGVEKIEKLKYGGMKMKEGNSLV
jgi:hypothetical protein